ncbi:MAG: elongation factor P--(R)-beta-lysine ligase [Spirochaetaceae bacterium]|nr:MAG: elongation factor P--(R)-beta-lysine ligase [Spirochaetaceae bacterium]
MRARAEIVRRIRAFFDHRGYLAAETPQLTRTPIPEAHIELFATDLIGTDRAAGIAEPERLFLLPSPEYHLKQLLAQGSGSLYEITHSFRNAESRGPHHNPEFTMLEYYTVEADARDSMEITTSLLEAVGENVPPLELTMQEAWERWTGVDLEATLSGEEGEIGRRLAREVERRNLSVVVRPDEEWEDLFQRIFLSHVEPEIPRDRPVFLTQYPAAIPTLARTVPDTPWSDRWELYLSGLEVANCFGEERDPRRIAAFAETQARKKDETCRVGHPRDKEFLQPPSVLPRCSGVALGVDRLVMHLLGEETIQRVISFPLF